MSGTFHNQDILLLGRNARGSKKGRVEHLDPIRRNNDPDATDPKTCHEPKCYIHPPKYGAICKHCPVGDFLDNEVALKRSISPHARFPSESKPNFSTFARLVRCRGSGRIEQQSDSCIVAFRGNKCAQHSRGIRTTTGARIVLHVGNYDWSALIGSNTKSFCYSLAGLIKSADKVTFVALH